MIIDTHFHAFPKEYLDLVPEISGTSARGDEHRAFNHREYLDVMDRYGVDVGVLSSTSAVIERGGNREKAMRLCRVQNDSFADAHAKHPRRFRSFARLPMVHMDDCVAEMQ